MTDAQHPAKQHSTEFGSNQSGIEAANAIALEQALAIVEQLKARLAEAEDKIKGLEKVQSVLPPDSFGLAMQTLKEQQNTLSAALLQAENVVVGVQINVNDTRKADRTTFQLRKEYLAVLANQLRDLSSLRALDTKAANPNAQTTELRLTHIYTTLNTTERVTRRVPKQSDTIDTNDTHASESEQAIEFENQELALTALEAVRDRPKLVLLGEPGSGKSTFAQYIVLCLSHLLIQGATQEPWLQSFLGTWQAEDRNLLPVWITLREFAAWLRNRPDHASADDVHRFLEYRLKLDRIAESLPELIEPALRQGKALLLLDGLDEVIDPHKRKFICEAIVAYAKRYHADNRFLVTCRTRSYRAASDDDRAVYHRLPQKQFPEAQLADFNDEQIEHFIKAWHAELAQQEDETGIAELTRKCDRLVAEIPQRRHLRELAGNPLLLTLMAWIHTFTGELPQKRASFYERATQFLLWEWDQQKRDAHQLLQTLAQDVDDGVKGIERALWKAAFAAQEQLLDQSAPVGDADIVPDVSEQLLLDELKALKAGVLDLPDAGWADQVLYAIKHRSGLLKQRLGHTLTFPHRTFQEYFAAKHLMAQNDPAKTALQKIELHFDAWNEVIPLATGYEAHVVDTNLSQTQAILTRFLEDKRDTGVRWRKVWLCGKIMDDIGDVRMARHNVGLLRNVRKNLTTLVTHAKLSPPERVQAGDFLANIGDERFDERFFGLPKEKDGLYGFVFIPAGPFCMGTRQSDFDSVMDALDISEDNRKQNYFQREIWPDDAPDPILGDYFIARYPVTVGQWKSYYASMKATHPEFELGDRDSLKGADTRPVVRVGHSDALQYCAWLTTQLQNTPLAKQFDRQLGAGWKVTLPNDAQWEKAARGPADKTNPLPRRLFTWGDEADAKTLGSVANISFAEINRPSAVGSFPKSASVYGVHDLIGNVWEWSLSLRKSYPYVADDGRNDVSETGARSLRGGAFFYDQGYARVAFRYYYVDYRLGFVGFRVSVSPANSS